MTKTIEEAERRFYSELELRQAINDCWTAFMDKPLASRLTAEEKERVRETYVAARDGYWDECNDMNIAVESVLERIFGADFFKEEE